MKAVVKVSELKTLRDIDNVRQAISLNIGVIACQITKEKSEVEIIYDDKLSTIEEIIDSIENSGYIVL